MSEQIVWWLVASSFVMFVGSAFAVPAIVIRLPQDYFCNPKRKRAWPERGRWYVYLLVLTLKNILGVTFLVAGAAMLVLPGQGILSILIGLSLTNFPGKYRLERYLATRRPVLRSLNWIRRKASKPPFRIPHHLNAGIIASLSVIIGT